MASLFSASSLCPNHLYIYVFDPTTMSSAKSTTFSINYKKLLLADHQKKHLFEFLNKFRKKEAKTQPK